MYRRREFLRASVVGAGALAFGPAFWRSALAAPATPGAGPYGPLQPPDANGIMLPQGFTARPIAQGDTPVGGTTYTWHIFSDGQATFATDDGGWILVSNSENPPDVGAATPGTGGASAIRFGPDGSIRDAYRILSGTSVNCAGGATPWGTWLSCEEHGEGQVWECDPTGQKAAVARPAMGVFEHEAVAVDPGGRRVYLSEDNGQGGFYRFTPASYPDLSAGTLEVAQVGADGFVNWLRVPDPSGADTPTRQQVEGMTRFSRGEGMWYDGGVVYLCTTNDNKVHAYDTVTGRIDLLYDGGAIQNPPLTNVDNITVSRSGDVFVCEDTFSSDDPGLDIAIISREREVTRFLKVTGNQHTGAGGDARSELCGVVFDPSGQRMYFASQRALVVGIVYEVTGPFRLDRPREPKSRTRGFRVHVPPTVTHKTILGRGLPFSVVTSKPLELTATLTARFRSGSKTRTVTLARAHESFDSAGRGKVHLRPGSSARKRIRSRRSIPAKVTIVSTDAAGLRRVITRSVRIAVHKPPRR
jgi:secreted PhoX family phosphatase